MDKEMLANLSAAVSNGRTDIVRTLVNLYETRIKEGGTEWTCERVLSSPCNSFGTLLHLATKLDHVDIVRTLLCSGADPNVQNTLGETPFDLVQSQNMSTAYVDELLKCSAKSEVDRICQLVNAGVDVNAPDSPESGNRALHWAVCFGKPQAVQCLLDLGALPNVVNGQGATPLHEAVKRKNTDILRILLMAGADPTIQSTSGKYFGKTPLDLAEDNTPVAALLSEYVPNNHLENDKQPDGVSEDVVENDLSASLHSLSTASEASVKPNNNVTSSSAYVPQSPSFAPLPLITDSKLHLLWPQPQKIVQTDGPPFRLEAQHPVHIVRGSLDSRSVSKVWETFASGCSVAQFVIEDVLEAAQGIVPSGGVLFHVSSDLFSRRESYKLVVNAEQIRILASDVLGAHYALCTLGQLLHLYSEDGELPSVFIHDWPQLHHRAVLLDLSVDVRKPTMETLKCLIQTMSLLKVGQLHCYFRYDLLSTDHDDFPYPNRELLELVHFCLEHHVQLVPAIDVHSHAIFSEIERVLNKLIRRLVTLFSSRELELGPNLSKLVLEEMVSSDTPLGEVLTLPPLATLYVCCSGSRQNTDLTRLLPVNCVLVDYAYQVEYDYDFNAKFYTEAGYNFCIGTGTKTWGSIAGIPESTVSLVHKASTLASTSHCSGLVIADWKTLPHHPALCFSWPGILVALGMAWNCNVHQDYLRSRLSELLNLWVWRDASGIAGYLTVELGRLETFVHMSLCDVGGSPCCQTSVLHQVIRDPDAVALDHFTQDVLQQACRHLKKFELELQKCEPLCPQHGEVVSEIRLAIDFLLFACKLGRVMVSTGLNPSGSGSCGLAVINVGVGNLPPIARTDLANRLLALTEQYRAVWLSRCLPCGLQTSLRVFHSLLHMLVPDSDLYEAK